MAYELYTTESVFADNNINAICNALLDNLETQFSSAVLNQKFGLTGTVAKTIQGATNLPVKVIPFVTNDVSIYNYLYSNIKNIITTQGVIGFTDRFQVITSRVYIEIWKTEDPLNLVDSNGIFSQTILEIPYYIL